MAPQLVRFSILIWLLVFARFRCEDQHCMDKATKEITVEIGGDNPQRVMTLIRDEPGYQVNLQCKWILRPANYDSPRQMYIQIPVVDFDTKNVPESQCNSSNPNVDLLTMMLRRNQRQNKTERCNGRESTFKLMNSTAEEKPAYMCSDSSIKVRKEIVNLWDPSYNLALEFRSDDKQVRSDAKGVQVDVQVLGRSYCHRTMLFFEGSCYLITPERLTPAEAFKVSSNFLGNVFTVPKDRAVSEFLRSFHQRNTDRQGEFPYESPLALANRKMWTGYFLDQPNQAKNMSELLFMDPARNCCVINTPVQFKISINGSQPRCGVAMQWNSDGSVKFTCESMEEKLAALIEFKEIPRVKGDTHPQLFRTCDTLPSLLQPHTTTVAPSRSASSPESATASSNKALVIGVAIAGGLIVLGVIVAVVCVRRRKSQANRNPAVPSKGDGNSFPESVPLNNETASGKVSKEKADCLTENEANNPTEKA